MKMITPILKKLVLLLAIFAGSQSVGQNIGYYAFIPDAAGDIDREGFEIGYHSIFSEWDLNGDDNISETEFYTVVYQRMDTNKNGSLSLKEWDTHQKYLFSQSSNNSLDSEFNTFDSNNDKKITSGEFDAGMRNNGIFRSYDSNQDGKLDQQELNNGVFGSMDLDGNGIIEKDEYSSVHKLYMN